MLTMNEVDKIKVPYRSSWSRVEKALAKISSDAKADGQWHKLIEMGLSSAEQTARSYNVDGGRWQYGYTHGVGEDGEVCSFLWVRWIG